MPSSLNILAILVRTFLGFSPLNSKHRSISPFFKPSPDSEDPNAVNFEPLNLRLNRFFK